MPTMTAEMHSDLNVSYYDNYDNSNSTVEVFSYPESFVYLVYTLYAVIFIPAVIGNSLVIFVVLTHSQMRTVTNYLIANLALGDLLMALLCIPFGDTAILQQSWPFGTLLCHIVTPAQCVFVFVSAWTLVMLSVERWCAICFGWGQGRWEMSRVRWSVCSVWIGSFVISLPVWIFTGIAEMEDGRILCEEVAWPNASLRYIYTLTLMTLQYFLPITVLIFTYSHIAIEIWWKAKVPDASTTSMAMREQRMEKARKKTISMLLLVVTSYTLAWLPQNLLWLYQEVIQDENEGPFQHFPYVFILSHWLSLSHTTVNPLIYALGNERFLKGGGLIRKCCG